MAASSASQPFDRDQARALVGHIRGAVNRARAVLGREEPFDPSRLDRRDEELITHLRPLFHAFNRAWLRLRVEGLEHLGTSPVLYAGNHNGGILGPDLPCTMATLWDSAGATPVHALAHDFAMVRATPLGRLAQAVGGIRARPESAMAALSAGFQVLVYPGGERDAYRHYKLRHRIVFGDRTGFVRVAQRARVPIVPIVAAGAHESAVFVHDGAPLAELLRLRHWSRIESFPIGIGLPWVIGAGAWVPYLPLPFAIRLRILEPISVTAHQKPEAVRDEVVCRMQHALTEMCEDMNR